MFVKADKTNNIYKIENQPYQKVLHDRITKNYKKADEGLKENIDATSHTITSKLQLEERIERYSNDPAYTTFKDHKENFNDKLQCRLINPAKNPIGRISKKILDTGQYHFKSQNRNITKLVEKYRRSN